MVDGGAWAWSSGQAYGPPVPKATSLHFRRSGRINRYGSAVEGLDGAVGVADEGLVGLVGEQAVLDHAEGGLEGGGQGGEVGGGEGAVEEVVALVGDERGTVGGGGEGGGAGARVGAGGAGGGPGEPDALDRQGLGGAEVGDELGGLGDDHHVTGGGENKLLAEEGAAPALEEVEGRVDLVGAVDGQVEGAVLVQVEQLDAGGPGPGLGPEGGGDRPQRPGARPGRPEQVDQGEHGPARPEADGHARLDPG